MLSSRSTAPLFGFGRLIALAVTVAIALVSLATMSGCAGWQKQAKGILDVAQVACILAHQNMPDSDVAELCDIAQPLWGPMRSVLSNARLASADAAAKAAARASASKCPEAK